MQLTTACNSALGDLMPSTLHSQSPTAHLSLSVCLCLCVSAPPSLPPPPHTHTQEKLENDSLLSARELVNRRADETLGTGSTMLSDSSCEQLWWRDSASQGGKWRQFCPQSTDAPKQLLMTGILSYLWRWHCWGVFGLSVRLTLWTVSSCKPFQCLLDNSDA